jgi:hypothetical protein
MHDSSSCPDCNTCLSQRLHFLLSCSPVSSQALQEGISLSRGQKNKVDILIGATKGRRGSSRIGNYLMPRVNLGLAWI